MALTPGARLGVYEITTLLGVGGMGEVYRATDTKLKRQVAIKILPSSLSADADRLARFQREAEVLASLNHPNIGTIHGLEETNGITALVMELVEGEDLSQRIARGAIPLDEAMPIAKQIAEALESAHEHGIIHRDLKPANIKVREDGTVKVLDFGLAKATESAAGSPPSVSLSPTITTPAMTQAGVILGTAAYMSPEQAKGRPTDKRSDVWAFGCVFYEMLCGRRAFAGEDVADTLATVLKGEPDWNALPKNVPPPVRALIQGCLRKDRKDRIGDISTALFLLGQPRGPAVLAGASVQSPVWRRALLVVAAVLVLATIAVVAILRTRPLPAAQVTRFTITLPVDQPLRLQRRAVALSPDGTQLVYAPGSGPLYVRSLPDFKARPIPGTDAATNPVFSPDGQSLMFWDSSSSSIKQTALSGGTAVTIFQAGRVPMTAGMPPVPSGMSWGNDGILFSQSGTTILRVFPNDGKTEVLLDLRNSEDGAFGPQLLPDGDTLLFTMAKRTNAALGRWDEAEIVAESRKTKLRKGLIKNGSDARYVPTGHIVYMSGGTLFARRFDLQKLEVTGGAVPVVEGVQREPYSTDLAHYVFSNSGTLVYVPGSPSAGQQDLLLFDRTSGPTRLKLPPGNYNYPRVSPDGNQIVFETDDGKVANVSVYDLSVASQPRRLTFAGNNRYPIWSGDGLRVAFQSDREGDSAVWSQPSDVGGINAERLTSPDPGISHIPESWSPDSEVLLFSEFKDSVYSLWMYSLKDRKATLFSDVKGSSIPTDATFSPDGKWITYQHKEPTSPGTEGNTFVQPFPPTGAKHQIDLGGRPMWSRDGRELFFVPAAGQFKAVAVTTAPRFTFTNKVSVPRGFGPALPQNPRTFDILEDGRFVVVGTQGQSESGSGVSDGSDPRRQIHVVLNWFEELKRIVPAK